MAAATVPKLYRSVIDDVINAVREVFLDDGVDEQVLQELKQTWEKKLGESKAIDTNAKEPEPTPKSNRSNNSNRNSNRDNSNHQTQHQQQQAQALQQQHHPPLQHHQQSQPLHQQGATSQQITAQSSQLTNAGAVNHVQTAQPTAGTIPQQAFTGLIQPSVIYTTTPAGDSDGQKTQIAQKFIIIPGPNPGQNQMMLASQLPPEILQQLAMSQQNPTTVITQAQPSVVQHTSSVAQNPTGNVQIQYQIPQAVLNQQRPPQVAAVTRPPQQVQQTRPPPPNRVVQLDGVNDSSDEDDDEDDYRDNDDDHDDNDDDVKDDDEEGQGEEEEPLNSEDDVSDEDPTELFDTDNVVVCQYDKITRSRNKWKFHLKDGIMNLQGKDYVFQKAIGDAEW